MAEEEKTGLNEDKYSPYEGFHPYVFVSYSHDDPIVKEVIHGMIDKGYRVWYDAGIHHGDWNDVIEKKIEDATAFVVFLSKNSIESKYVNREILLYCNKEDVDFVPIWIEKKRNTKKTALKILLDKYQNKLSELTRPATVEELVDELTVKPGILTSCKNTLEVIDGVVKTAPTDCVDLNLDSRVKEVEDSVCKDRADLQTLYISDSVLKLGAEAFRGCKSLLEVKIPGPLQYIGDSCFRDCIQLRKLIIYDKVEIGERAFENCSSLHEIILPDDLAELSSGIFNSCKSLETLDLPLHLEAIGDSAFASCVKLKSIVIPEGVKRIDDLAFAGCESLEKVVIPNTVTRLGKNVFKNCKSLKEITIPASVTKIDPGCFRGCIKLEKINVEDDSDSFRDVNGVLFTDTGDELIAYPAGKKDPSFKIEFTQKVVQDWAFADAKYLEEIIIDRGLQKIGEGAFSNCDKIEKLIIPKSVRVIQDTAFRGCEKLKTLVLKSDALTELGWGPLYACTGVNVYANAPKFVKYCHDYNIQVHSLDEYKDEE